MKVTAYGHRHFRQPKSLQMQVDLVNAVTAATQHPLNFVAFIVPKAAFPGHEFEMRQPGGGVLHGKADATRG